MGLIIPPPSWANCTTNLTAASSTAGTTVTAGTANADGTTVSLISAITHDVEMLAICFYSSGTSGANTSGLADIMIDPAGGTSWNTNPLINDLLCGYAGTLIAGTTSCSTPQWYYFPIWIKSGTSIGVRMRNATASRTAICTIFAYGGNAQPSSWWCGQDVTSIGITAASSLGTLHTAGNTGAFSAWTNFGSTTPAPCGAVQFGTQGGAQTTMTAVNYMFEFGVGSTRIGAPKLTNNGATEIISYQTASGPIFCEIPSGTQLQVRGSCSATAQAQDVAAYVVH